MSACITIVCEASNDHSMCPERVYITEQEIVTARKHPDASPRYTELDTARHIAAGKGWRTVYRADIGRFADRCPVHSGTTPRPRRRT